MRALDNGFYVYISMKCGLGGIIEFARLSSMYLEKKSLGHHLISIAHLFHLICIFNANPHRISLQSYWIGLCQAVNAHTTLQVSWFFSKKLRGKHNKHFMVLVLGISKSNFPSFIKNSEILMYWLVILNELFNELDCFKLSYFQFIKYRWLNPVL